jgi:chitinase
MRMIFAKTLLASSLLTILSLPAIASPTTASAVSVAAYNSASPYVGGSIVAYEGKSYHAKWYAEPGQSPAAVATAADAWLTPWELFDEPATPIGPVTPIEPVAPVEPIAPVVPVTPVGPATCKGTTPWDAATRYKPGDKLTYKDHLLEAKTDIWNAAPDHCPTCDYYADLGACDADANQAPTAMLSSPVAGSKLKPGEAVTVGAQATDADGKVTSVEFFANGHSLGADASEPFEASWTPATKGSYNLTAIATDDAGATGTSAALRVMVDDDAIVAPPPPKPDGMRNIGYFPQWGIYGRDFHVKGLDTNGSAALLTHINYAFGNVRNNVCEVGLTIPVDETTGVGGDAFADYQKAYEAGQSVAGIADTWDQPLRGSWNQLKQLKAKYPHLKVLISLGGWTYSRGFPEAARAENREKFVASCVDAYIKGDLPVAGNAGGPGVAAGLFDGIDVDWEFPASCGIDGFCGNDEDTENFTALLAEFRKQLDAIRPGLLLTTAIGAGVDKIRVTRPGDYHQSLDYINVMTYDFHGGWETSTNFHSSLRAPTGDPSTGDVAMYNSHDAIQAMKSAGVPAAKLNLGIGFYGRGWKDVPNVNNGLFQSGTAAAGTYGEGVEDYKVLKNLPYPHFYDAAGAHWVYGNATFWSFDDPTSIATKMRYVKSEDLGGAFSWDLSGDDADASLMKAMASGLGTTTDAP